MTITASDIKLLASLRMTDAADGGGPMSGQPLQDGAENNVWPDISSTIDPARGALQFRAVYMAVLTANTDALRQAHVILQERPAASGVDCLLVAAAATVRSVSALAAALNAAGDNAEFRGATATTANAVIGATTIPVGGIRTPLIPKGVTVQSVSGSVGSGASAALPLVEALLPSDGAGGTVSGEVPRQEVTVPVVAGQLIYTITVPAGTLEGTEVVSWPARRYLVGGLGTLDDYTATATGAVGSPSLVLPSYAPGVYQTTDGIITFGQIDRGAGTLTLVFSVAPRPGNIVITFGLSGGTTVLAPANLAASAFDGTGKVQVTLTSGQVIAGAELSVGGVTLALFGGLVYSSWNLYGTNFVGGTIVGTYSAVGLVTVLGRAGQTITGFEGAARSASYPVAQIATTIPPFIDPATLVISGETSAGAPFTATGSAQGTFSTAHVTGSYIPATGLLSLTFAANTKSGSLTYAGTQRQPQASFADLWGLTESAFPGDGRVRVIRAGQVGVLRHTSTVAAATYSAGATVNLGRTDVADVRVIGADGIGIYAGWTANLAAGTVSISNVTGWSQPVTIEHAIEHVSMVSAVPDEATVILNRPLTRAFPSGSLLSTAVLLGDLQARVSTTFSQQSWDDVWSDTRTGPAIPAQYQDAAYPIAVSNLGAVSERWAIVFKTSTTFDLIGETLGRVASGDTATVFAPVNPATSAAYMTIQPAGWGVWSTGNVLRINTIGAAGRVWAARTVSPGATVAGRDQAVLGTRGDINV